ncbi:hypothetical protein [Ralstonia pseudosolanacearum]|uniref:hypothetical protein n=1 Tax=Ralstonia pseudosolanacearum TaxID=1310165 RepID=UPI0022346ABC|nr:hypothetical protein [Ralstonia sp. RS647]UZF34530.1 hypothetical protein LGV81_14910 [Ralstonia sp. RS647]
MDIELTPIRKVIDGVTLNTETAHIHGMDQKVVTEYVNGESVHRYVRQGLYQVLPDGPYFLTFWNRPQWDDATLKLAYVEDLRVITTDQAKQWMQTHCPAQYQAFEEAMGKGGETASAVPVNLRMPAYMRATLMGLAGEKGSFNKLCINYIQLGLDYARARQTVYAPSSYDKPMMPNGQPALDDLERANTFEDPNDQALAKYMEDLYAFHRHNPAYFLPFALNTLHRLFKIQRDVKRGTCFALCLAAFHRYTPSDAEEVRQRRPGPVEYGEWRWIKYDPPFDRESSRYSSRWDKSEGQ